jgi:hypothetical protein
VCHAGRACRWTREITRVSGAIRRRGAARHALPPAADPAVRTRTFVTVRADFRRTLPDREPTPHSTRTVERRSRNWRIRKDVHRFRGCTRRRARDAIAATVPNHPINNGRIWHRRPPRRTEWQLPQGFRRIRV